MRRQAIGFFSSNKCYEERLSGFHFLEHILDPLLQIPGDILPIISKQFSVVSNYEFHDWDDLKDKKVPPPSIELFEDSAQQASEVYWEQFKKWRERKAISNKGVSIDSSILDLLEARGRELSSDSSRDQEVSFLMALLAESTNRHSVFLGGYSDIFKKEKPFMDWLKRSFAQANKLFQTRVSLRYFIFEAFRLSPELSKLVARNQGWESLERVAQLREDLLKL
eukprot:Gregarina_sp_Poly_1__3002@NODE_1843_length_3231_cov_5_701011_g1196_i0_p1_GENE_NODE_1843_length_3231_cov_5_701011_g1196_i0NODE_1843_length_3231_cov_5_701011_g1196_i0_p1_ORF_typecomplete_len223_score30_22Sir1/PF11603_8/0_04CRIC_ras_sig/PF10534_9/0_18_NODE_1843_length_3231_cov_5_701011_g1196_i0209877